MSGLRSREKGKRGERECAKVLNAALGIDTVRRGQQYSGIEGRDLVGIPGLHMEVKRVERLNLQKAYDQACLDSCRRSFGDVPVIFHRTNSSGWLCTVAIEHIEAFMGSIYLASGGRIPEGGPDD